MTLLTLARHSSGRIIDVTQAERGDQFTCTRCMSPLIVRKGEINRHHFAHKNLTECEGAQMTLLHLAAQQLIVEKQRLPLPAVPASGIKFHPRFGKYQVDGTFESGAEWRLDGAAMEVALACGRFADVSGMDPAMGQVVVEVLVTHEVDQAKADDLAHHRVPCVEIDLSDLHGEPVTMSELTERLFGRVDKTRWVYHPQTADFEHFLLEGFQAWVSKREKEEADAAIRRTAEEERLLQAQVEKNRRVSMQRANLDRAAAEALLSARQRLGLGKAPLPYFIDLADHSGRPFAVDGGLWRAVLFAEWIHGRLASPRAMLPLLSPAKIATQLGKLVGASSYSDRFDQAKAARAVRSYLRYLQVCGVLEERSGQNFVVAERPAKRLPQPKVLQWESHEWNPDWPSPKSLLQRLERFAEVNQLDHFDPAQFLEELLPVAHSQELDTLASDEIEALIEHCGGPSSIALRLLLSAGLIRSIQSSDGVVPFGRFHSRR